jgi:hypothetical protein
MVKKGSFLFFKIAAPAHAPNIVIIESIPANLMI